MGNSFFMLSWQSCEVASNHRRAIATSQMFVMIIRGLSWGAANWPQIDWHVSPSNETWVGPLPLLWFRVRVASLSCHHGGWYMSSNFQSLWGGKDKLFIFIKGSYYNCINLIFTLHLPEEKRTCNSLGDIRSYQIFLGCVDTQKNLHPTLTWQSGHLLSSLGFTTWPWSWHFSPPHFLIYNITW